MNKNKKGYAYVAVVVTFVIIMIFVTAIASLFSSNLRQTTHQEKSMQAYYIARSGIDLSVAALTKQITADPDNTLLHNEFSEAAKPNISSIVPLTDTITFANGKADITISACLIDTNKRGVNIHSVGTLNGTGEKKEVNFKFVVDNPEEQKWD